jgi:hypothetical protein
VPELREPLFLVDRTPGGELGRRVRIERLARTDDDLDRAMLQDAGGARAAVLEGGRLAGQAR